MPEISSINPDISLENHSFYAGRINYLVSLGVDQKLIDQMTAGLKEDPQIWQKKINEQVWRAQIKIEDSRSKFDQFCGCIIGDKPREMLANILAPAIEAYITLTLTRRRTIFTLLFLSGLVGASIAHKHMDHIQPDNEKSEDRIEVRSK